MAKSGNRLYGSSQKHVSALSSAVGYTASAVKVEVKAISAMFFGAFNTCQMAIKDGVSPSEGCWQPAVRHSPKRYHMQSTEWKKRNRNQFAWRVAAAFALTTNSPRATTIVQLQP